MNIYIIGSSDGSVGLVSGTSPISIAPSLRYTSATANVYSPKSVYISPHSSVTSTTPPPSVVNMPPLPSITSTLSSPCGANVFPSPESSSPPVASTSLTPSASKSRSPLSELLVVPNVTPKRKKANIPKSARVLTSTESFNLLLQKEQKKKKEQDDKERRKREREENKLRREQEKVQKEQDKLKKRHQQEARKAQKEREKMEKEKSRRERQASKENVPVECTRQSGSSFSKQYPIRKGREERRSTNIPDDQCAICYGAYTDDIDEVTEEVLKDWIQCTDKNCGVWAHTDCLEKQIHGYLCGLCFNFLQ